MTATVAYKKASAWGSISSVLLPAVTLVFGLQLWRALLPLLVFVLRDRFGWNALEVGALAFGVFLVGFLAGPLQQRLGAVRLLVVMAGAAGILRLALQVWTGDPVVELALALAGSVFFILSLPSFLSSVQGPGAGGPFALGILLGLALDLGLHGFWRTYDLNWQGDGGALAITGLLFLIQVALLVHLVLRRDKEGNAPVPFNLAWFGIGPYFFLALLVWQNLARLTVLTGWMQAQAFVWMMVIHGLALALVTWMMRHALVGRRTTAAVGLALIAGGVLPWWPAGLWAAVSFLLGHVGGALALTGLLRGIGSQERLASAGRVAVAHAAAMLLFALFAFLYYSGFDIRLPFSNRLLPLVAAVLLGITALAATWSSQGPLLAPGLTWHPVLFATILLALPVYRLATLERPADTAASFPLRVMTYNIHNGFATDGHLGMQAVAAVIEAQEPDVVALQEVSRGWVTNGSLDTLIWLAQRLDMHAHFAPTSDALWGMGILSRTPLLEAGSAMLPPDDLLLKRGYQWAVVDVGQDGRLTVVNTHLHHPEDEGDVRVLQAKGLIEKWGGTPQLMIAGDFNARPSDPEMALIAEAGMTDVVSASGLTPGYTFPSVDPYKQIDYILLSADLTVTEASIPSSNASDHLPIAAIIRRAAADRSPP